LQQQSVINNRLGRPSDDGRNFFSGIADALHPKSVITMGGKKD
jgi:hypothetical protein